MIIKKLIIVLFYGPNEAITGRPGRKYRTFWDFCEQFNFLQCGHENKIQKLGRILLEHNEAAPGPGFVRVTGWKRHFDKPGTQNWLFREHTKQGIEIIMSVLTCLVARGTGAVLHVARDAPVAGVGQGVVILVDHGKPRAPLEVLCCETVLKSRRI